MLGLHDQASLFEFFKESDLDRFKMTCPRCRQGNNSTQYGGNERCFHCDNCGLIECEIVGLQLRSAAEKDSIID